MTRSRVSNVTWEKERIVLRGIREQVFILEQNVPVELEWDGLDEQCEHFLAYIDNEVAGCARLLKGNKIGRMAVLKKFRNQGVGRELLECIKRYASQKRITKLSLSAQCHAYEFYENAGFHACSTPYLDAGITHIDMECRVLSQHEGLSQFKFKQDPQAYYSNKAVETKGYLELMLSQSRHSLIMCANNLSLDIYRQPEIIEKIKALAKKNRHFKFMLLMNQYHPTHNDHPLLRLISRLPTFCEIRIHNEPLQDQMIFDKSANIEFSKSEAKVSFKNKAGIDHFLVSFNRNWEHAKNATGARRLVL